MAPLPEDRVEATPSFTYCGVDCFGPFYVRHKRSDIPRYDVIFTCLMSKVIHLEVADTMDTSSFINALRRFIAIRGPIRQLRCDRVTNFVRAKNELAREYEAMDQNKIKQYLQDHNCDYFGFKFNVPHVSHMSGVGERLIRTVKSVLQPMLIKSGSHLDDENELFCEVMNIVNNRPLTVDTLSMNTHLLY